MKILFVSTSFNPFKDVSIGAAQRTHFLLKACAACAETDVCAFVKDVESDIPGCKVVYSSDMEVSVVNLEPLPRRLTVLTGKPCPEHFYHVDRDRARIIDEIVARNEYDLIVIRYLESAISYGLFKYSDRLVIDIDDNPVSSHRMRISAKAGLSGLFPVLKTLPDMRVFKYVQKKCHFTFFSNPEESRFPNSAYLPNLPFLKNDEVSVDQRDVLFFVGALNYMPNRYGITHFVEKIWPVLKVRRPSLVLRIAGVCGNEQLISQWLSFPGVEYLGFVEDIRKEYSDSKIVIAPIYSGAGTNIKVLEAMSMGKVCVTTPTGMRGFGEVLVPERDLFVASDDDEFSSVIERLLDDDSTRRIICRNALEAIRNNFTEERFVQSFSKCLVR